MRKFRPILTAINLTLMNTSHSITQPTRLDSFCVNPLAHARRAKPVSFHFTPSLLSFAHNGASAPQTQPEGLDNRRSGERSEQHAQPQPRTTLESSHPRFPTGDSVAVLPLLSLAFRPTSSQNFIAPAKMKALS